MILCIFIYVFILTAVSCPDRYFEYSGDYPDLYTVAISSILHLGGADYLNREPFIRKLYEDEFGRVLFSYCEGGFSLNTGEGERWLTLHLISQKTDGEYVYFYEHINFVFIYQTHLNQTPVNLTPEEIYFNLRSIERLKYENNWGQRLSCTSKFARIPFKLNNDDVIGPVSRYRLAETARVAFPDIFRRYNIFGVLSERRTRQAWLSSTFYFRSDPYGRSVYTFGIREPTFRTLGVFVFQPDHTIDIDIGVTVLSDRFNHQTELKNFFEANGWNTVP